MKVNNRFGTNFNLFEHTESNEQDIFKNNKIHLSPNKMREEYKPRAKAEYDSPTLSNITFEVEDLYRRFLKINAEISGDETILSSLG